MWKPARFVSKGPPFIRLCIVSLSLVSATSCNTSSRGSNTPPSSAPEPALAIASSHAGDFTTNEQGAIYSLIVTNQGTGPTNGTVNVAEIVPTGMTLASMTGSGWNCTSNTCARSDVLSVGANFPTITATVNVSANAPSPETNQVSVAGGGSASATGRDTTVIVSLIVTSTTCAGLPSGNESVLSGQYAGVAQGWQGSTPSAMAFSVALDGAGNVRDLGGGNGGDLDVNDSSSGPRHFTIQSAGSLYKVGPDPGSAVFGVAGDSGFVGCLQLQTPGGSFTFAIAPGSFTSGVAARGMLLQIDSTTTPKSQVAGELRLQDSNAFGSGDTTALHTNYAFGEHGGSPKGRHAMAGSFVLDPLSGSVSFFTADQNEAGTPSGISGAGMISSVSRLDGRATATFTTGAPSVTTSNRVLYVVNSDEIFTLGSDLWGLGSPIRSGQAVASAASFDATSIAGNHIVHTTGQFLCTANNVSGPCAIGTLGLLSLSSNSSTTGAITGTLFQYDIQDGPQTTTFSPNSPGTFALASSTGRVTLGNMGANPPVLYLASPTTNSDPVTFFIVSTDAAASFGYAEQGASASVSNLSLPAKFFVGNDDSGDPSVWSQIAVISNFPFAPDGTWDYTWSGMQLLNADANEYAAGLNITNLDPNNNPAPGLGTAGVGVVAITNGKRVLCLLEGGQFSKDVTVGGKAAVIVIAEPQ